jgi:hypothetical protein
MAVRPEMEAGRACGAASIRPATLTFGPKMIADRAGPGHREGMAKAGGTAPEAGTATLGDPDKGLPPGGGATVIAASAEVERPTAIATLMRCLLSISPQSRPAPIPSSEAGGQETLCAQSVQIKLEEAWRRAPEAPRNRA